MADQPDNTQQPPQDGSGGMMVAPGDQEAFDENSPEAKDHMMAAFKHLAGLGPHPGKKSHKITMQRSKEPDNDITDVDRQRAAEDIPQEASAQKMKAAQTGGAGLGPPAADVRAAQQQNALAQQAAAQGAVSAAQAQGAQTAAQTPSGPPPPAPTTAKAGPQAMPAPQAPPAPGPQETPPQGSQEQGPPEEPA